MQKNQQQVNKSPLPRRPRASSSTWTDTDIDHLSEISQADIIQAVALWRANVPPALTSLLDAEVIEHDGSTSTS